MYQLVFSPYCYVYVFYSSSEWGLGVSLSSSQRIIACIWVFLALRVCVQVVNGARKTGISCLSTFYWVWFLCLFLCVCVEVVNGSGKRGIGLLGGNEGAQLLTLRSAGGEQRLNRTKIHLSIWNYFYWPASFVNLDLRHELRRLGCPKKVKMILSSVENNKIKTKDGSNLVSVSHWNI